MSVGEINLKSCLLPHFPHSLIPLSFQAYPNSIETLGDSPSAGVQGWTFSEQILNIEFTDTQSAIVLIVYFYNRFTETI